MSDQLDAITLFVYVAEGTFETGLALLVDLRKDDLARLLVGRRGRILFTLTQGPQVDKRLEGASVGVEQLRDVAADVADVLGAAISDVLPDEFAARRSQSRADLPGVDPEDPDIARRKFALVASAYPLDDLRRRAWIKQTSLSDVPHAMEWEVVLKHADDTIPCPSEEPVKFATFRLVTESNGHELLPAYTHSTVTLDEEDVANMIDTLVELQEKLTNLKGTS